MAKSADRTRTSSRKPAATPGKPAARPRAKSKPAPAPAAPPLPPGHDAARVVVFSCQWAPHYAFQSLYRRGRRGEGEGVRVLTACIGRVGEDLVLEAFRQGADGVAVLSCPPELCRHGLDHAGFTARLASLRAILATLGIPPEQLFVAAFQPHEGERLAGEIAAFAARVRAAVDADRIPATPQEVAP